MNRALLALIIGGLVFRVSWSVQGRGLPWAILFAAGAVTVTWNALNDNGKGTHDRQG